MREFQQYINGAFESAQQVRDSINPATGQACRQADVLATLANSK